MTLHTFTHKRKVGLADETGRVHAAPTYDRIEPLVDGRRAFYQNYKHGFLDEHGYPVIPGELSWAQTFALGWAVASTTGGLYGLLGPDGAWGLAPNYAALRPVSETLAIARPLGASTWGLLEIASEAWHIAPTWSAVHVAAGRMAVKVGRKFAGIDFDGEELVPASTRSLLQPNADGTWIAQEKRNGPFHRLSATGEVLQRYGEGIEVRPFHGPRAAAKRDDLWGLIDVSGHWAVEPISSGWLEVLEGEPIRIWVNKRYGYVLPDEGLVIPATFVSAGTFIDGHTIADLQVIDRSGTVVATINPTGTPVVLPPPLPPKGRAARALVASFRPRTTFHGHPDVAGQIRALPDPDIVAVLHAWYTAGMPWILLGDWDLWTTTYGAQLEAALREGRSVLPFGHGAYNDPINLRFPRGRLEIGIDSNPDDTRPRKFSSLESFTDAMVVDALKALEAPWPLPVWLLTWVEAGGVSGVAELALAEHTQRVAKSGGAHGEEAAAWLAEHRPPTTGSGEPSMTFEPCEAPVAFPDAPAEVHALLNAGGHKHYLHGARWVAVSNRGIRFADDKGKRRVASLSWVEGSGPAVVLLGEVALVAGKYEAMRVTLPTGKKDKLFERPFGELGHLCPIPAGTAFVAVPTTDDSVARCVRVYDLSGQPQRDIPTPNMRFVNEAIPLWGALVAFVHTSGVVVVDVAQASVVALHDQGIAEASCVGERFTIRAWGGKLLELR